MKKSSAPGRALVGIIANPSAGKDIRRLVAHGRLVPDEEKVNTLRRLLAGLAAVGVRKVLFMPDASALGRRALDGERLPMQVDFLEMPFLNAEEDSTRAASLMDEAGVGCLVTLGGDGTNRAVAKGCGRIPLLPISTGTNNVFPFMVEPTVAGLAAGAVARGLVSLEKAAVETKRLEVYLDGDPVDTALVDTALVDAALSRERFVGARAIWDMDTVREVCLTRAEPTSIGLSSIGAQLQSVSMTEPRGIYFRLGRSGTSVLAPIAPGRGQRVHVSRWRPLPLGERVSFGSGPCTVALDGERSITVLPRQRVEVAVTLTGPRVVAVDVVLREMASLGVLKKPSKNKLPALV